MTRAVMVASMENMSPAVTYPHVSHSFFTILIIFSVLNTNNPM
uniref:Uncharacterized protein n=1 Tax=Ralstonia syzygii R24 TaxID=907261 RepID=G3A3Q6_9RALS|nr:hypothetical protein RALSY_30261 [Ralstonia syzygii R24]